MSYLQMGDTSLSYSGQKFIWMQGEGVYVIDQSERAR